PRWHARLAERPACKNCSKPAFTSRRKGSADLNPRNSHRPRNRRGQRRAPMSIIIVLACLVIAFFGGVAAGKAANVLNAGKAIKVGVLTGVVLGVIALLVVGGFAAGAALVGAIAGSIVYCLLTALAIGDC